MSNVIKAVERHELTGMVGNVPWGRPIELWPTYMLKRALDDRTLLEDSPHLANRIRQEFESR